MKILITVAVWGGDYRELFVNYSLASHMASNNIPRLSENHEITYHIITTSEDCAWLSKQPMILRMAKHCTIDWDLLEDHGYNPELIPTGPAGEKYSFLSLLQNIAIEKSLDCNAVVFNYADFIWSNGSLSHAIESLTHDVDAVLSFCLPVDKQKGIAELDGFRRQSRGRVLDLPARDGADLAIRCLHREAKLRYWDDPAFTVTPTYLMWPVEDEGIIVRAYHQTILVLRVKPDDPTYRNGIAGGSLDGYFTSLLAEHGKVHHTASSDDAMVFSLYDAVVESQIGGPSRKTWTGFTREVSLRECLRGVISEGQRKFAMKPIEVRRTYDQPDQWKRVARESEPILESFHKQTVFDPAEYKRNHTQGISLQEMSQQWRFNSSSALEFERKRKIEAKPFYERFLYNLLDSTYHRIIDGTLGFWRKR